MTTPPAPPTAPAPKSWFWNSLGMAGLILICCGVGPFAVITIIDIARDSSSSSATKSGGVMAGASHSPSPQERTPRSPLASTSPPARASLAPPPRALPSPDLPEDPRPPQAAPPAPAPHLPPPPPPPGQPQIQVPQAPAAPVSPEVISPPPSPETVAPQPEDARIGDSVRDGMLEFVVREVRCGLKQIGTDERGVQAQGQFCVVTLSVRNVGDRPQVLLETEQVGIGADGSAYASHSMAGLIANEPANQNWLAELQPGGETVGVIVYELPEGVDLAQLQLNDPTLPGGVIINLG